jgi:hypothetical protein
MKEVKKMLFKRNYKHNGQWYSVVLDGAGLATLHEKLRQDNLEVLKQCFKDASRFGKDARAKERVAVALFGKLADAKYTRINATLDEMAEEQKELMGGGKSPPSFSHNLNR